MPTRVVGERDVLPSQSHLHDLDSPNQWGDVDLHARRDRSNRYRRTQRCRGRKHHPAGCHMGSKDVYCPQRDGRRCRCCSSQGMERRPFGCDTERHRQKLLGHGSKLIRRRFHCHHQPDNRQHDCFHDHYFRHLCRNTPDGHRCSIQWRIVGNRV